WSTLQVFITNDHPKSKLMWFIIPFDEYIFKKIWPIEKNHEGDNNDYTSNQFTEKCFQLVIDVPTPITSNWIDYLKKMSDKAFEKWNDPNLSRDFIKQYRDYFSTVNHSPTPRSINNIINQVQALQTRFMHEKQITINAITIYSLLRRTKNKREIKDIILYPQTSKINESILKRVKAYEKELSSILFHMPYSGGLELLLDSEIESIIHSNDDSEYEKLVSLQADYGDAFWQAWEAYYQKFDYKSTLENVRKSSILLHIVSTYFFEFKDEEPLLSYINILDNTFTTDANIIFEELKYNEIYEYIKNLNKLSPISDDKVDVIKIKTSEYIANYLGISGISLYNSSISFAAQNKEKELSYIKKLIALLNIKHLACNKINGKKEFSLWCAQQDSEGIMIPEILPDSSAFKEITSSIFSENYLNEGIIKKLHGMAALNPKWDGWGNAIENICNWARKPNFTIRRGGLIQLPEHRSTDNTSTFFSLVQLLNTHSSERVKKNISELLSSDSFISGLPYEFESNKNNKGLALLIKPIIDSGGFIPQPDMLDGINNFYKTDDPTCSSEV
ncbi:MAG: hypothetical protein ACRDBG_15970, partial [Waterburya sp.]